MKILENQASYARRHGVSKMAVSKWKRKGFLVFEHGLVDVKKSDDNLRMYRSARSTDRSTTVNRLSDDDLWLSDWEIDLSGIDLTCDLKIEGDPVERQMQTSSAGPFQSFGKAPGSTAKFVH